MRSASTRSDSVVSEPGISNVCVALYVAAARLLGGVPLGTGPLELVLQCEHVGAHLVQPLLHLGLPLGELPLGLLLCLLLNGTEPLRGIVVLVLQPTLGFANSRLCVRDDALPLAVPLCLRPGEVVPGVIDGVAELRLRLLRRMLGVLLVLCDQLVDGLLPVEVLAVQL